MIHFRCITQISRAFEAYVKNLAPSRVSGYAYIVSWSTVTLYKSWLPSLLRRHTEILDLLCSLPPGTFPVFLKGKFLDRTMKLKRSIKIISIENFISEIEIQFELNNKFFRLRKDIRLVQLSTESVFLKKRQFYENSSLFMMVNRLDNWLFL